MDLLFLCPNCRQELEVDASGSGSQIECPSCGKPLTVPEPDPQNIRTHNPINSSAAAKEEKHFSVPVHDAPAESLIQKPKPPLEAAKNGDKQLRTKCIKRVECVEVGKDHFDEVVTAFLSKVAESDIVSINTISYSTIDIGSQKLLNDFGVMIVYRG